MCAVSLYKGDDIVLAKLAVPELPSCYVERPYLFDQLKKGLSRKVILVSSPVGFGKTTLLAEWHRMLSAKDDRFKTTWLTLDSEDDDTFRFWKHLGASLEKALPGIAESDAFDAQAGTADTRIELNRSKIRLSNYLHQHTPEQDGEYVLFLDNADAVSGEFLTEIINYFLVYFPPCIHVVIAGAMTATASLDYEHRGSVYEFPAADLAFSRQELMSFMACQYGDLATESLVRELYDLTRGWTTGVRLFTDAVEFYELRNMRTLDVDLLYSLADDYFSSYATSHIDNDLAHFLICSSILEKMSPSLCDYLLERSDSKHIITDLANKTYFIQTCGSESGWYEYHPLFLHWLRTKLFQMRAPQVRELATRAQDWHEMNGKPNEAAKYMLMASDADLIDSLAAAAYFRRDDVTRPFAAWVCGQSAARIPRDTRLSLYVTWGYLCCGRSADTLLWLSVFEENLQREAGAAGLDRLSAAELVIEHVKIKCKEFNGHYRECIDEYKLLLDAPATISLSLRVVIVHAIAESYERLGEFGLALEYYLQTEALADLAQSPFFVAFGRYAMSWILVRRGELRNAEVACSRALNDCPTDFTLYGALQALSAYILVEKNELPEAEKALNQAMRRLSTNRNADMLFEAQVIGASYTASTGNLDEAYRQIVRTVLVLENAGLPRAILPFAYSIQAKIALRRKNIEDVESILRRFVRHIDPSDLYYVLQTKQIEVFLKYYQNDDRALGIIEEVLCESEAANFNFNTITLESLLLKAVILNGSGKKSEALVALNEAIHLGSNLGLIRPFLDFAEPLHELFHEIMNVRRIDGVKHGFLKNILKSLKAREIGEMPLGDGMQNDSVLTRREAEVLDLLNVGMSRQEIADALGVSHNTVKTHLNNIYSKLGVSNRSEVFKMTQA